MVIENDKRISVCVPTYNRGIYLNRFLLSLSWSQLSFDEFEVIIADDGSSDGTELIAKSWREQGMDISHFKVRQSGVIRNGGIARNVAIRRAKYPIILGTDPEMVFVSDVLLLSAMNMKKDVYCTSGQLYMLTEQQQVALETIPLNERITKECFVEMIQELPNMVENPHYAGKGVHAAFSCWKEYLNYIRGYNERFTEFGWEDVELTGRLEAQFGLKRKSITDTIVVHQWHPPQKSPQGGPLVVSHLGKLTIESWNSNYQRAKAENLDLCDPHKNDPHWGMIKYDDRDYDFFEVEAYKSIISNEDRNRFVRAVQLLQQGEHEKSRKAMPRSFRDIFKAHLNQARLLAKIPEQKNTLRKLLYFTLSRPWENSESRVTWNDFRNPPFKSIHDELELVFTFYTDALEALERLATVEIEMNNTEKAKEIIDLIEGESSSKALSKMQYLLTLTALMQGDTEAATDRSRKLLEKDCFTLPQMKNLYRAAVASKNYDVIYTLLISILRTKTELPQAELDSYVLRLNSLMLIDENTFAVPDGLKERCNRTLETNPELLYEAALLLVRIGEDTSAVRAFENLAQHEDEKVKKRMVEGRYHLATAKKRTGQADQAKELLQEIVKSDSYRGYSQNMKAACHFHLGELLQDNGDEGAATHFRSCLELCPEHSKAQEYLRKIER